jgi:hypothetical protein
MSPISHRASASPLARASCMPAMVATTKVPPTASAETAMLAAAMPAPTPA